MRTALLLTSSEPTRQLVDSVLGRHTHLIDVPPGNASTVADFNGLFLAWLMLADVLIIDCVALAEHSKPALESLISLPLEERHAVVLFLTSAQRSLYAPLLSADWLLVGDRTSPDELRQLVATFLDLRVASHRLAVMNRRSTDVAPTTPAPGGIQPPFGSHTESYGYRDALKRMSRLLADPGDERDLLAQFLSLVSELLGLARSAFLVKESYLDLEGRSAHLDDRYTTVASIGVSSRVSEHLRLNLDSGIPRILAANARILCRGGADSAPSDPEAEKEFELLGTDCAFPLFTDADLTGIFTCSGRITAEPLTNQELELTYHLVNQVGAALARIRLHKRAARQEAFISRVLSQIRSGVVVLDTERRVRVLNDRARELLEMAGQETVREPNELPARVLDVVFEALKTGVEIRQREVILPRSRRVLSVSATRLEPADPAEHRAGIGLIEDVTPARSQEAQAQKLREQELFMRMAYRLSHELKNSLVSVKTFLQLLPVDTGQEEAGRDFGTLVLDEVNRIDSVVQNLSFFAQSPEIICEDIPVSELVSDSIAHAVKRAVFRKLPCVVETGKAMPAPPASDLPVVTIKTATNGKDPIIRGDRKRLTEAFEELLLNAIQSMPKGGRILISASTTNDNLSVEIKDTGQGIALENLGKVTQPFYTTRNVGVGLGLTVVEKIVNWHGGKLTIDSKLGQGSTVTVNLPVRPPSETANADSALK